MAARARCRAVSGWWATIRSRHRHGLFYGAKTCMYWLHTRAADGLIEVQSPVPRHYTLGDFFRIWNQPLSSDRVATARGPRHRDRERQRWRGDPTTIPLTEHADIELAVGRPVPAQQPTDWVGTGLERRVSKFCGTLHGGDLPIHATRLRRRMVFPSGHYQEITRHASAPRAWPLVAVVCGAARAAPSSRSRLTH